MSDSVWNESTIAHLRDLWAQGLSTAKIGSVLGISKSAVIGKAHRLSLDARKSPIQRARSPEISAPKAEARPRAKKVAACAAVAPHKPVAAAEARAPSAPAQLQTSAQPPVASAGGCKWPMWSDVDLPSHLYCGAARQNSMFPYCDEHRRRAVARKATP